MPDNFREPSPFSSRYESILAGIIESEEQGRIIDENHYLDSYPEFAELLREYFYNRKCFPPQVQTVVIRSPGEREMTDGNRVGLEVGSLWAGFFIEEELGRGGMGIVYRARQLNPERWVALKVIRMDRLESLPAEERRQWLDRFQREVQLVAALDRPEHIVHLYEVGEHAGQPYFTMRLVAGGTLAARLQQMNAGEPALVKQKRERGQRDSARLLARVARAVHYAHQRGILHRDLKPANILLDEQGEPLVSDFGLARRVDQTGSLVQSGIEGTAEYMAPEQARAEPGAATTAADIYSLGAILYECLTGRPPFRGRNPVETLLLVLNEKLTPPRRLNPRIDRDLEIICLKCLQEEPGRRYSSAAALADDLDNWLAGRPLNVRPPGPIERLWRWCRRNPVPAAAAALIGATIAIAFVLISLSRNEAIHSRNEAIELADKNGKLADEMGKLANEKGTLAEEKSRLADEKTTLAFEKEKEATRANTETSRAQMRAYFLSTMLSRREWLTGNVAVAEKFLDECPASLRRWEWGYLKQLCNADLLTLEGHTSAVCAVAFEPNGRRLASAGEDGTLVLWNAATGEKLETLRGHTGSVLGVAFSAGGDRLASAGADGSVRIWDAQTGQNLFTCRGHTGPVNSVAFAPSGRTLVSAGGKKADRNQPGAPGEVIIWNAATSKALHILRGHASEVWGIAFSPNGRQIASSGEDGTVMVWDAESAKPLGTLRTPTKMVPAVAFSPDGRYLAAACGCVLKPGSRLTTFTPGPGGAVRGMVWDATTGRVAFRIPETGNHTGANSVAFSPDGRYVAFAGVSMTVSVYYARTGTELVTLRGHTAWVGGVAFSPDGSRLASADLERRVKVWDLTAGQEGRTVGYHSSSVDGLDFSHDGGFLVTAGGKALRLWDTATGRLLRTLNGHSDLATKAVFSPDDRRLASVGQDGTLRLWDVARGTLLHTLPCHPNGALDVAYSPDGKRLASTGNDHTVKIWDAEDAKELHQFRIQEGGRDVLVSHLTFSPDGQRLAVACGDKVRILDVATGQVILTPAGQSDLPWSVAISPDGSLLAAGSLLGTVDVWRLDSGRILFRWKKDNNKMPWAVAFSPDGKRLAGTGSAGDVVIWEVDTGQEVLTLPKAVMPIPSLAFSPDGRWLAAASGEVAVQLWDSAEQTPAVRAARRKAAELTVLAWHRREAKEGELLREPVTVAFHLGYLIEAEPNEWLYRTRRAFAHFHLARWGKAIDDSTVAIAREPNDYRAWYIRGCARVRRREWESGIADLTEALKRAVPDASRTVEFARKLNSAAPAQYPITRALGAALYRADQFEEAVKLLTHAVNLRKQPSPSVWLFLAMAQQRCQRKDQAKEWLRKAKDWIAKARNSQSTGDGKDGLIWERLPWTERLALELLEREAVKLIEGESPKK